MSGRTSRRAVLAAIAGAGTVGAASAPATVTFRVRVVPATSPGDRWTGWDRPALEAFAAVGVALERFAAHVERTVPGVEDADWELDALPGIALPTDLDGADLLRAFGTALADRASRRPGTVHLLLAREPFNPALGYGTASGHVSPRNRWGNSGL